MEPPRAILVDMLLPSVVFSLTKPSISLTIDCSIAGKFCFVAQGNFHRYLKVKIGPGLLPSAHHTLQVWDCGLVGLRFGFMESVFALPAVVASVGALEGPMAG